MKQNQFESQKTEMGCKYKSQMIRILLLLLIYFFSTISWFLSSKKFFSQSFSSQKMEPPSSQLSNWRIIFVISFILTHTCNSPNLFRLSSKRYSKAIHSSPCPLPPYNLLSHCLICPTSSQTRSLQMICLYISQKSSYNYDFNLMPNFFLYQNFKQLQRI